MYAAYSAAFSRMLSDNTPGRETEDGVEFPLKRSFMLVESFLNQMPHDIRTAALPRPSAAATGDRGAHFAAAAFDNSGRASPAPPEARASPARRDCRDIQHA